MPTLNWIGKEAVVNHHHQVPFRLLKDVPELAAGDGGSLGAAAVGALAGTAGVAAEFRF
jgi:hypothetical protein